MRKAFIAIAAVALLAMPSAAAAKPGNGLGKATGRACADERREIGKEAFREKYGKQAMRNCKRETLGDAVRNAAQECKSDLEELGADGFREEYGTNHNGRNAFGKCVSGKVREELGEGGAGGETPPEEGGPAGGVVQGPPVS